MCFLPTNRGEKGKNSAPSHRVLSYVFGVQKDLICCPLSVDVAIGRASVELHRRLNSSVF